MLFSRLRCVVLLALPLSSAEAFDEDFIPSSTSVLIPRTEPAAAHVTPFDRSMYQRRAVVDSDNDDSLGGDFITITDTTNTLQLLAASNGNLNLANVADATSTDNWTINNNTVFADSSSRFLHYYPDLMSAYGVSRLRVGAWGSIPLTANLISFLQISTGGIDALVAIDTLENYYFPVVCLYDGGANKVFLVNDTSSLDFLADASLRYTVTGGVVSECDHLALVSSGLNSTSGD